MDDRRMHAFAQRLACIIFTLSLNLNQADYGPTQKLLSHEYPAGNAWPGERVYNKAVQAYMKGTAGVLPDAINRSN
jgi:hypothetical protein